MTIVKCLLPAALVFAAVACNKEIAESAYENANAYNNRNENPQIGGKNFLTTPSLVKMLPGFTDVETYTLISSDDMLAGSPNFIFAAQTDGVGLLKDKNSDGCVPIENHGILRSVSRVYLNKKVDRL